MHVLVADDHDLVRNTLCAFLQKEQDIATSEAGCLDEALADIAQRGGVDLVLLDYRMPGMDGLGGLTRCLRANEPGRVALISGHVSAALARDALAAGAIGFVPKTIAAKTLTNAVRMMASGEQYAPVSLLTEATAAGGANASEPFGLTQRELQVLSGLLRGRTNKDIGAELGLQLPTVKLHVKTLCRKLNAQNRTQAAMIAREAGIGG